jgi:hypothetical protein
MTNEWRPGPGPREGQEWKPELGQDACPKCGSYRISTWLFWRTWLFIFLFLFSCLGLTYYVRYQQMIGFEAEFSLGCGGIVLVLLLIVFVWQLTRQERAYRCLNCGFKWKQRPVWEEDKFLLVWIVRITVRDVRSIIRRKIKGERTEQDAPSLPVIQVGEHDRYSGSSGEVSWDDRES